MNEAAGTQALNKALAALQAELPHVGKSETAQVPGKDGKRGYTYTYADLAAVSSAVLPLLGKHGMAFTAKPTLSEDGRFVLAYSLRHESGESDDGTYPLPSTGTPQQIGSAITYARRYCLCAVTGIAPADDDDGAAASEAGPQQYSAGDVFEHATPVRARAGSGNSRVSRPAPPQTQETPAADPDGEPDETAQELAAEVHEARTLTDLRKTWRDASAARKLSSPVADPVTGEKKSLIQLIEAKRALLEDTDKALKELHDTATARHMGIGDLEEHVRKATGADFEAATPGQLRKAAAALRQTGDAA